jgi:CheY-like chemotaxis protein
LKGNDVQDVVEVFVVDDNVEASDTLSLLINTLGHKAAPFYDGESVIAASRLCAPLCVFLDVNMAGMNGLQLAETLRREFGDDIVLIAVTGMPRDDATVARTFETVDHYFTKPVTLAQIKTILSPR